MMKTNKDWAHDDEDEEQDHETQVDSSGIKERIKYITNSKGQKVKTVTRIKVQEIKTRTPLGVISRRNFVKFGDAVFPKDCVSKEIAILDHPMDEENEVDLDAPRKPEIIIRARQEADYVQGDGGEAPSTDVDGTETKTTIRVSNISRTCDEQALRSRFGDFGRLTKFSLPKVAGDLPQYERENKGYAFVAFEKTEDAQAAFAAIDGKGFEYLILKLEWAKPDLNTGSPRATHYTGYGKALAQDTKEKAVFTSHGNS